MIAPRSRTQPLATPNAPRWASPKVFREGWDACLTGHGRAENPYEPGGSWAAAWTVGWDDAQRERSKDLDA